MALSNSPNSGHALDIDNGLSVRQDPPADSAGRIDPVVRIAQAGPREAASLTSRWQVFGVDHERQAPLLRVVGRLSHIVRVLFVGGLKRWHIEFANLVARHCV